MDKIILWFFLSCKRQLKKPFFLILLLILPAGGWMFHRAEEESPVKIAIALFTDGDEWNEGVAKTLEKGEYSFEFYRCETLKELEIDVVTGQAECGYYFPEDFRKLLREGKYKRSIRLYVSPSTVADKLSSEVVFSGMFKVFGRELLKEYTQTGEPFEAVRAEKGAGLDMEAVWAELEPLYNEYLENGSTFAFEYETAGKGLMKKDSVTAVFPVRGIGAVFIFVMGLAAAVTVGEDEARGLFTSLTAGRKKAYMAAQLAAPILLSCLSVSLCLQLSGSFRGAEREWAALLLYGLMTLAFSGALLVALKSPLVIAGLIPFFILGSLIVCPVFADLSSFVPELEALRKFFLPYYYLTM